MREIKFRFWDKRFNKFRYDLLISNDEAWDIDFRFFAPYPKSVSEHVVVQQYTGLKDKNGVEIYEGDALKDEYGYVKYVYWTNSEDMSDVAGFTTADSQRTADEGFGTPFFIIFFEDVEVVGNIFEGIKE